MIHRIRVQQERERENKYMSSSFDRWWNDPRLKRKVTRWELARKAFKKGFMVGRKFSE